ncbi:MAG TPA: TIGR03000 domain-containing protein, partial [Gemmataceae bacterium]|nr:TIGR03000 domain-containing protein [Gemmataceae bacterium]
LKEAPAAQTTEAPKPARVTVRAPDDARLTIDGRNCPLTNGTRTFETPRLEVGKKYFYEVEARVQRDGRQLVEKRKVTLEAGKHVDVDFTALGGTRAAALR